MASPCSCSGRSMRRSIRAATAIRSSARSTGSGVEPHDIWPSGQGFLCFALRPGFLWPPSSCERCGTSTAPWRGRRLVKARLLLPSSLPPCIGSFRKMGSIFPRHVHPRPDVRDASVPDVPGRLTSALSVCPHARHRKSVWLSRFFDCGVAAGVAAPAGAVRRYEFDSECRGLPPARIKLAVCSAGAIPSRLRFSSRPCRDPRLLPELSGARRRSPGLRAGGPPWLAFVGRPCSITCSLGGLIGHFELLARSACGACPAAARDLSHSDPRRAVAACYPAVVPRGPVRLRVVRPCAGGSGFLSGTWLPLCTARAPGFLRRLSIRRSPRRCVVADRWRGLSRAVCPLLRVAPGAR